MKKVESVQRRFTKRLKGMAELQYSERLLILGAETLELRRLKADLMYIYKIVFGLLDVERLILSWRVAHPPGRKHTAMRSVLKRPTAESMNAVIF